MDSKDAFAEFDAVVVGGGLAGVCAAVSAARLGCRVALVQDRPVLGGNSSSEIRVPIGGAANHQAWARETGIMEELFLEDRFRNHRHAGKSSPESSTTSMWDLILYETVKNEPNITLLLNTSARKVAMADKYRINSIVCDQLGTEKEFHIVGNIFIDCTGDGTIGFLAGAKFMMGREGRGKFNESLAPGKADKITMGNSLMFVARDMGRPVQFDAPKWAIDYSSEKSLRLRHPHIRKNCDISGGYWWIELGGDRLDIIRDNEILRDELLKHLLGLWDHMKNHGDHGAENYALEWIGMVPGKRESRRFMGDHILTENDIRQTAIFPDAVGYGGWIIDLHTVGGLRAKNLPPESVGSGSLKAKDSREIPLFSIPYRCLYSKNIENLMFAGRDISATHVAFGTTRLMATCAILGQVTGTAAFFCKKFRVLPRDIHRRHVHELQQTLLRDDCFIPGIENEDEADLARNVTVTASSSEPLVFGLADEYDELDVPRGQIFPVSGDRVDKVKLFLRSKVNAVVKLHFCRTDNLWSYRKSFQELKTVEAKIFKGRSGWVEFSLNCLTEPKSFYWVYLEAENGVYWRCSASVPPGTVCLYKPLARWHEVRESLDVRSKSYVLQVSPDQYPYGGENVVSGVNHPEKWTNIWISDCKKKLPQHVELDFGCEKTFNAVQIAFDTNLNMHPQSLPSLYCPPECARDYSIHYWRMGKWKKIIGVTGNHQRFRRHVFNEVAGNRLKLEIEASNGAAQARVYEIRVYGRSAREEV